MSTKSSLQRLDLCSQVRDGGLFRGRNLTGAGLPKIGSGTRTVEGGGGMNLKTIGLPEIGLGS